MGTYSKKETPLRFKNRIAYSFEEGNKSLKFIDNSFWLQSVKNYSKKAAIEKISISMTPQLRLLRVSAGAKGRKTRIVS